MLCMCICIGRMYVFKGYGVLLFLHLLTTLGQLGFLSFIYLFLDVLGLDCCPKLSPVAVSGGYLLPAVCKPLIVVTSLVVEHGL